MAAGEISLDRAYLVAIWLETLFYGINICLFVSYLYITRFRRVPREISPLIFWIACLMFAFSSVHVSLGFARLIWGFIDYRDEPGGPAAFFSDVSQPPNVAKVIIHTINSILGDSIVVWRCYHVWTGEWRVCVLPVLLIIGSAICGFGQAYIFATAKGTHSAFATTLARWNGSLFSLSLITNLVVTGLIAIRLWYLTRETGGPKQFRFFRAFMLIIESAMIYSAALLIEIILYFSGNNAFYIVYDPIAQLTGIVPTTIIIVAALGLTYRKEGTTASAPTTESTVQFSRSRTSRQWASTVSGKDVDESRSPKAAVDSDVEARLSAITWQNLAPSSTS
ncbi:hypothetical protein LXA43DRAFT_245472 [Ganoderma leucocontextum]|nr:hypothetical protein LXA43DRAFT_245472 [Ganoderma leucocontextum]